MLDYNALYEILRKEKYSEVLQQIPKEFISDFKFYLKELRDASSFETNLFSESSSKSKKQIENAISLFREIILKRKKKILQLVFVATETGMMKRDYENMLPMEKETFEKMVKIFEEGDKQLSRLLHEDQHKKEEENKMVIIKQDIEQFVDTKGNLLGPFKAKELASIDSDIAKILIAEGKASIVDEN